MKKYNPLIPQTELIETPPTTTSKLQTTQDDALKYMFLITISAIVAAIIITYLLTRRSL
jgi:hypothetical protein